LLRLRFVRFTRSRQFSKQCLSCADCNELIDPAVFRDLNGHRSRQRRHIRPATRGAGETVSATHSQTLDHTAHFRLCGRQSVAASARKLCNFLLEPLCQNQSDCTRPRP
jgi:hypothetical protein